MGSLERTLAALAQYNLGHNRRVAGFPPPQFGKNPVPPQFTNGPSKRNIPSEHPFNPNALKPMSKALWASSVALGHALTAYRHLSRLKSTNVSPDGMLGGRGYVMGMKDARQRLFEACEALSTISDTLHDEITAPHWKPKLAQLDENDQEDVSRFVSESEDVMEHPEEDAEKDIKKIEQANDDKGKGEQNDSSGIPDGGPAEESVAQPPKESPSMKQASDKSYLFDLKSPKGASSAFVEELLEDQSLALRVAAQYQAATQLKPGDKVVSNHYKWRGLKGEVVKIENVSDEYGGGTSVHVKLDDGKMAYPPMKVLKKQANSSIPVDSLPGPRVDHIGPAEGDGPWGSYNEDEYTPQNDDWSADEGGAGRRHDDGEDYDYPSTWENDLSHTAGWSAVEATVHKSPEALKQYFQKHPKADKSKHTVEKGKGKGDEKPKGKKDDDGGEKKSPWGKKRDRGPSGVQQVEKMKADKAQALSERKEKEEAERADKPKPKQGFPERKAPKKDAPKDEKKPWYKRLLKKGDYDYRAESAMPYDPDTETDAWDFGLGYGARGQGAGGYANPSGEGDGTKGVWGPQSGLPGSSAQPAGDSQRHSQGMLPQDVAGPPARTDYYQGPKDNLVQSEGDTWGDSELPGEAQAPVDLDQGLMNTGYVSEDTATPYVRYDDSTRNERPEHQQGRPEELPWAHDTEVRNG